jgi:hypothetical protein
MKNFVLVVCSDYVQIATTTTQRIPFPIFPEHGACRGKGGGKGPTHPPTHPSCMFHVVQKTKSRMTMTMTMLLLVTTLLWILLMTLFQKMMVCFESGFPFDRFRLIDRFRFLNFDRTCTG